MRPRLYSAPRSPGCGTTNVRQIRHHRSEARARALIEQTAPGHTCGRGREVSDSMPRFTDLRPIKSSSRNEPSYRAGPPQELPGIHPDEDTARSHSQGNRTARRHWPKLASLSDGGTTPPKRRPARLVGATNGALTQCCSGLHIAPAPTQLTCSGTKRRHAPGAPPRAAQTASRLASCCPR